MVNDLSNFISMASNKLNKGFVTFVMASVLSACGGGGGGEPEQNVTAPVTPPTSVYVDDPAEPETAISGGAIKGVIRNASVRAYQVRLVNGEYVPDERAWRNEVTTDANGNYVIKFKGRISSATFLIALTAQSGTQMICDVVDGCLDADGNVTPFGSPFTLTRDFTLWSVVNGVNSGSVITASLTPMSHMATSYAMSLPGGLTATNIRTAKRHVENILDLDDGALDIPPVDIVRLASTSGVSKRQLEASIMSAAFLGLVNTPRWSNIAQVLDYLSDAMIDAGTLANASASPDAPEVALADLFYEANQITGDLISTGSASNYTSVLNQVSTETLASYQSVAEEPEPEVTPVSITAHPQSVAVNAGAVASFAVGASGGGSLSFQWRKDGVNLSGATSSTLSIASAQESNEGVYDVVVSNSAGSVTSLQAVLTVNPVIAPVAITTQPVSLTRTAGQSAAFSVVASGGGTLSYQWRKNGTTISGATAATLTLSNVQTTDAASYSVVVSNSVGSVTSTAATLTVNQVIAPVSISSHPVALTRTVGESAQFAVTASGGGTLSYQWRKNGVAISGATSASLNLTNVQTIDAASYSVVVTNSVGSVTSNAAALTVNVPLITIGTQPVARTVNEGAAVEFSVTASGTGTLTYQWYRNNVAISGATSARYGILAAQLSDAGSYRVQVSNGGVSAPVSSNSVTLTVNQVIAPVSISSQPVALTRVVGQSAQFSVTASGGGTLSYQWRKNGVAISGATSATLSIASVQTTDAASYSVVVTNSVGSLASNAAALTVQVPVITISSQPVARSVNEGDAVSFSVVASSNGVSALTYQWYRNDVAISGATSATYSIAAAQLTHAGSYRVQIGNGGISTPVSSNSVTLTVADVIELVDIELNWAIPDQREDATYLDPSEIGGYVISYGTRSGQRTQTLNVSGGTTVNTVLEGLTPGTYYFAIATVDADGQQGAFSSEISVSAN